MRHISQTKLLRVPQKQQFERVGGTQTIHVDVRVIAATNKDLEEEVTAGRCREDLYYRLNVVPIRLPPLRERREDIPLLAQHFLEQYATKNHRNVSQILPKALDALMRYDWPGNIRELENAIERAVIITRGEVIAPHELPLPIQEAAGTGDFQAAAVEPNRTLKQVEKEWIRRILEEVDGNRTHAAKILGITRKTLQNKIREYDLS